MNKLLCQACNGKLIDGKQEYAYHDFNGFVVVCESCHEGYQILDISIKDRIKNVRSLNGLLKKEDKEEAKMSETIDDIIYNANEIEINRTIETLKNDLIDWGNWSSNTHGAEIDLDDVKRITRVVFELERRMKV